MAYWLEYWWLLPIALGICVPYRVPVTVRVVLTIQAAVLLVFLGTRSLRRSKDAGQPA